MELFGLRLDKREFQERFGLPIELALPMEMAFFTATRAFAENSAKVITLTPRGRYLLVIMMREFFSSVNRVRDQARQIVAKSTPEPAHRSVSVL
jgi:menaquinone C8-methyltransferase